MSENVSWSRRTLLFHPLSWWEQYSVASAEYFPCYISPASQDFTPSTHHPPFSTFLDYHWCWSGTNSSSKVQRSMCRYDSGNIILSIWMWRSKVNTPYHFSPFHTGTAPLEITEHWQRLKSSHPTLYLCFFSAVSEVKGLGHSEQKRTQKQMPLPRENSSPCTLLSTSTHTNLHHYHCHILLSCHFIKQTLDFQIWEQVRHDSLREEHEIGNSGKYQDQNFLKFSKIVRCFYQINVDNLSSNLLYIQIDCDLPALRLSHAAPALISFPFNRLWSNFSPDSIALALISLTPSSHYICFIAISQSSQGTNTADHIAQHEAFKTSSISQL